MSSFYITLIELTRTGFNQAQSVLSFLSSDIGIGLTFLSLFTFSGLTIFLGVAIAKWITI